MKIIEGFKKTEDSLSAVTSKLDKLQNSLVAKPLSELDMKAVAEVQELIQSTKLAISQTQKDLQAARVPFMRMLNDMKTVLLGSLETMTHPYSWAITTYSASELSEFDEVTKEVLKQTLRDYFAPKGFTYEGWQQ